MHDNKDKRENNCSTFEHAVAMGVFVFALGALVFLGRRFLQTQVLVHVQNTDHLCVLDDFRLHVETIKSCETLLLLTTRVGRSLAAVDAQCNGNSKAMANLASSFFPLDNFFLCEAPIPYPQVQPWRYTTGKIF